MNYSLVHFGIVHTNLLRQIFSIPANASYYYLIFTYVYKTIFFSEIIAEDVWENNFDQFSSKVEFCSFKKRTTQLKTLKIIIVDWYQSQCGRILLYDFEKKKQNVLSVPHNMLNFILGGKRIT